VVVDLGRLLLFGVGIQLVVNLFLNLVAGAFLQVMKVVAGAEVDVVVLLLVLDLLNRKLGGLGRVRGRIDSLKLYRIFPFVS